MEEVRPIKHQKTLEDAWLGGREHGNNFDAIRLGAAALVIVSHSFEIAGGPGAWEPLRAFTGGQASLGGLAVMAFFVLSGFLLAKSWRSKPVLSQFIWRRSLRIAPALVTVVILTVFVIGPLLSALNPAAYFTDRETWDYLANLALYTKHDGLPGVFDGAVYPHTVNGPLWTLKFEVLCYVALASFGALGFLRLWPVLALLAGLYVAHIAGAGGEHGGVAYYLFKFADLGRGFFVGALIALLAPRLASSGRMALLCVGVMIVAAPAGLFDLALPLFGGYALLVAGLAATPVIRRAGRFGDFSYGLYLWGWPVQQVVATALGGAWFVNSAIALPLALCVAVMSWRLVEAPALALKDRALRIKFRQSHA
jgi:peptidoglycan/LPS O-acetylase OafA/YrhL